MLQNLEYQNSEIELQEPPQESPQIHLQQAKVREICEDSQHILVERPGELYLTKRAASCLSLPQQGDKVLFSYSPKQTGYILAVLETAPENNHSIQLAAHSVAISSEDLVVESTDMSVVAETLTQASQSKIETSQSALYTSEDLKVQVAKAAVFGVSLCVHLAALSQVFTSVMTKAKSIFTQAEDRQVHLVNSTHKISGIQISEAKETLLKADGNVSIQAKNVLMN